MCLAQQFPFVFAMHNAMDINLNCLDGLGLFAKMLLITG